MPRIRFIESVINITGGVESTELIKGEARRITGVDLRETGERQTPYYLYWLVKKKNLHFLGLEFLPSPLMWAGYRRVNFPFFFFLPLHQHAVLIGADSDYNNHLFSMSQSELIQPPFTRLEFRGVMAYPFMSTQYELYQSYTTAFEISVLSGALKGTFTFFFLTKRQSQHVNTCT